MEAERSVYDAPKELLTESLERDIKAALNDCPDDKKYCLQGVLDGTCSHMPSNCEDGNKPIEFYEDDWSNG